MAWTSTPAKAAVFGLVTILSTVVLALQINGTKPAGDEYSALFTDGSGMTVNSDVAAGVVVGKVVSLDVQPDNLVKVVFSAQPGMGLRTSTRARIRYKDVVGDRYLGLFRGWGPDAPLPPGGVIPVSQTRPALDLDELYNGFAPLFQGLQPEQINQLTGSLEQVLSGQGSSVTQLLSQISSLTGTLADRDVVIGQLVDNLNGLLGTLDDHSGQLNQLVVQLTQLVGGLDRDRGRIGRSLAGINDLTASVSGLLRDARPDLQGTVQQLDRLSTVVNADSGMLNERLGKFPGYYTVLGRLGAYSSAFQFYLCGIQVRLDTGTGPIVRTPMIQSGVRRCHY
jgi:phospholipid/cholesterol/gamma-HCH transport system substrate-binding protein